MYKSILSAAGLAAAVSAQGYTTPTAQTYGALLTPNRGVPIVTGENFQFTWTPKEPSAGVTVSLAFCNGPSTNCVLESAALVGGISASAGSYTWAVPCSLPEGEADTATGYGALIIVDGTGEFQYSTQFSVKKGDKCAAVSSTTTTTQAPTSASNSATTSPAAASTTATPASPSTTGSEWLGWSSSSMNSTAVPAYTASSMYTTAPTAAAATATKAMETSYIMASSSAAAATTAVVPKPYTGAAAAPTAFVNAAGIIGGAAVLAMLL